jgi:hypothetical protein
MLRAVPKFPLLPVLLLALAALPGCKGGEAGKFKHTGHVTIAKGACTGCHGDDPAAPKKPVEKACTGCHAKGAQLFAEFRALPEGARIKPHRPATYGDVIFPHGPHAGAGVACDGCHVLPQGGVKESSYPKMADCKGCHEKNGVKADCATCHREKR